MIAWRPKSMVLIRPLASSLVHRDPQTVVSAPALWWLRPVIVPQQDFLSCLHQCRSPRLMDKDIGICSYPKSPVHPLLMTMLSLSPNTGVSWEVGWPLPMEARSQTLFPHSAGHERTKSPQGSKGKEWNPVTRPRRSVHFIKAGFRE